MSEKLSLLKPRKIEKRVKKALKDIRKNCIENIKNKNYGLLTDNYYILATLGRECVKNLKNAPKLPSENGIPVIYTVIKESAEKYGCLTEEIFISVLSDKGFSSDECALIRLMAECAYINLFADCQDLQKASDYIKGIRNLEEIDFENIMCKVCETEKILLRDPAGVYPKCTGETKTLYRKWIGEQSKESGVSETEFAVKALSEAKRHSDHIGRYIKPDSDNMGSLWGTATIVFPPVFALILCILAGYFSRSIFVGICLYFPLWEIVKNIAWNICGRFSRKRTLPALEIDVVPEDGKTVAAVSILLPSDEKGRRELYKNLREMKISNGKGDVSFCVLGDYRSSDHEEMPEDAAILKGCKKVIEALNKKYGGGFFLAVRRREYSVSEDCFCGKERKRGAVEAFIKAMRGEKPDELELFGDIKNLQDTKYLMMLDADTKMPMNTVSRLVGAAMHPLNKCEISGGKVEIGYGIFVPSAAAELSSAEKSRFSLVMAGAAGVSSYDAGTWEFYMNMFGEGIFSGKGLIDVDAFYTLMPNAFPKEQVLSHDILEGGFLRAALVPGAWVTDSFPATVQSYLSRSHRWIRGDWQNIIWIFKNTFLKGERYKNPLNALSKYKLFDNLRRSLIPIFAAVLIFAAGFFSPIVGILLLAAAFLSVCSGEIFSAIQAVWKKGFSVFTHKRCSVGSSEIRMGLMRGLVSCILIPQNAFVAADGAVKALWRTFVSRRYLLQWVTAADSEKSGVKNIKRYLPSIVFALILLFTPGIIGKTAGLFFFFAPVIYEPISERKVKTSKKELTPREREKIISYCAAMWKYYEKYAGESEHFLPPDNVQQSPVFAVARRTSPTNIGMMMLSILAAKDMGFIDSEGLYKRLKNVLDSVEKLPKYRGNLFNWYSTQTLEPIEPVYVSSVDSGNFLCCITALKSGLLKLKGEFQPLGELAERIQKIIDETDLSFLYNEKKNLFHIGFSIEDNALTPSCYDLLMSEARMTSYFAVATGQAPEKHWGALNRTALRCGRYSGPVSWTGTMFEYYMPHILLPVYRNSLIEEALGFCLKMQKKQAEKAGVPFGMSESGYYAFDSGLNYQYKAHGAENLALKRSADKETVISPYSTFLVLPFDTQGAIENLRKLEELGLCGSCGFYEAVDFTPSRTDSRGMAVVRSFMAHHVGMSILSCANALFDGIMQKRFMEDEKMASAKSLLEEKISDASTVFEDVQKDNPPVKPDTVHEATGFFSQPNPDSPDVSLYTNGDWTSVVTSCGNGFSIYTGADITMRSEDLRNTPSGVFAFFCQGDSAQSFTYAPKYENPEKFSGEFSSTYAKFIRTEDETELTQEVFVHKSVPGEIRSYTVKNSGKHRLKGEIVIYFEPVLAPFGEVRSHPAFAKLFTTAHYREDSGMLVFRKRSRESGRPLYLAAGLLGQEKFTFETSREKVLKRPLGNKSLPPDPEKFTSSCAIGDVCCAISVPVEVPSHGKITVKAAMCAAEEEQEAKKFFTALRKENTSHEKGAASPFVSGSIEGVLALQALPHLFWNTGYSKEYEKAAQENTLKRSEMWQTGISGDYPIIYIELFGSDEDRLLPYLKICKSLYTCSLFVEIAAVCIGRKGETLKYTEKFIRDAGFGNILSCRGGVRLIDGEKTPAEVLNLLKGAAKFIVPKRSAERIGRPQKPFASSLVSPLEPVSFEDEKELEVKNGYFSENSFTVTGKPVVPWSLCLANPSFGTLVTNTSLGFTWAVNAGENKLTSWCNNPLGDFGGERLFLKADGKMYDIIRESYVRYTPKKAVYMSKYKNVKFAVEVSVVPRGFAKYVKVFCENTGSDEFSGEIYYYIEPSMGRTADFKSAVKFEKGKDGLFFRNPLNECIRTTAYLTAGEGSIPLAGNRNEFFDLSLTDVQKVSTDPCGAVGKKLILPPGREDKVKFILSCGAEEESAEKITAADIVGESGEGFLSVGTGDKAFDVMVNTWLPMQIANCRLMGRTGFYQCSGAWGFRDQLQDSLALLLTKPQITLRQIYRCCAVQFQEGDVLHWWHRLPQNSGGTRGVRTRCSDDLLWLPYAAAKYFEATGDTSFLEKQIAFLHSEELEDGENERYIRAEISDEKGTVYGHCLRAIERALKLGSHNLILIGNGDWNDGYNRVGTGGKGESVWLSMFAAMVMEKFISVAFELGDEKVCRILSEEAEKLKKAVDEHCWNGKWYLRAFYDDGEPMGTGSGECMIDSLPQSFAVFSDMPSEERVKSAVKNATEILVDSENEIIKLFENPFTGSGQQPGYVAAYPEGIRENGGQYTHGAVWLCMALLRLGDIRGAYRLFEMINPAARCRRSEIAEAYRLEPYFLAGDISSNPAAKGRGGWSLYTGSAGWLYTAALEFLGIKRVKNKIVVKPNPFGNGDGYKIRMVCETTQIEIEAVKEAGNPCEAVIPLDGKRHEIKLSIGGGV